MAWLDYFRSLASPKVRTAWIIAFAADALQWAALPLFAAGGVSPVDAVLEFITAALLLRLLGWHWALLPSFAAELLPGLDLFPTWTAAVFYITRGQMQQQQPEILPPGPAPARRND